MILSVSRRTDIPAFYSNWFMKRINEGFLHVRNPMNYHQISEINLSPEVIDAIVFWTKNPQPLLQHIDNIVKKYCFYFQYTLNAYGKDVEPYLPGLEDKLSTFRKLSEKIGSKKIIWRYDPILITENYDISWHIEQFERLAKELSGYTEVCVFSFIDIYEKVQKNIKATSVKALTEEEMCLVAENFSRIATCYGIKLRTCAEAIDLDKYGIEHNCCIDGKLIEEIIGSNIKIKKDGNQRIECGCMESIDVGQYNTCRHGCKYCYANFNPQSVKTFSEQHNPESSLLIGELNPMDKVTVRKIKSIKEKTSEQLSMF